MVRLTRFLRIYLTPNAAFLPFRVIIVVEIDPKASPFTRVRSKIIKTIKFPIGPVYVLRRAAFDCVLRFQLFRLNDDGFSDNDVAQTMITNYYYSTATKLKINELQKFIFYYISRLIVYSNVVKKQSKTIKVNYILVKIFS